MNKNLVGNKKTFIISFVAVVGILVAWSSNILNDTDVEATSNPEVVEVSQQPTHPFIYKLGDENDVSRSIENYEKISSRQTLARKEIIEAREAEKLAQETAKREAEEAEIKAVEEQERLEKAEAEIQEVEEASQTNQVAQNNGSNENNKVQPTQSSTRSNPSSQTTKSETQSPASSKKEAVHKAPAKTAPQPKPAPKQAPAAPKQESIGSNKIGINGTFKSYTNYGRANTDKLQSGIDSGLIVAGLTSFNGNDGETTYFGGHNPGIMKFIANSISIGSVMTITDGNGQVHQYKMIDKVDVDEYGEGVLSSIGRSAIDAYMYGTGTESILVQFCNTSNNLMSFWYGVKI